MTKQEYKNSILRLSACSLPVMLAVAGYASSTTPADIRAYLAAGDDVAMSRSAEHDIYPLIDQILTTQASIDTMSDLTLSQNQSQGLSCWMCMAPDKQHFWVSDGQDGSISTYRFTDSPENIELVSRLDAIDSKVVGDNQSSDANRWIDLQISDDGHYLYQTFGHSEVVAVYEVERELLTLVDVMKG